MADEHGDGGAPARVAFLGGESEAPQCPALRRPGKVTVRYNRRELQRRLDLEEWIDESLHELFACDEEEMPELEIDIDELLDLSNDEKRKEALREILQDCSNSPEEFMSELLARIKGMRKLSHHRK
uniref:protein phosphatase 1 regulatory subunit 14C-like n=1 Tax=Myxine glutinosa TaxID=7769 RepID=UPI00358E5E3F